MTPPKQFALSLVWLILLITASSAWCGPFEKCRDSTPDNVQMSSCLAERLKQADMELEVTVSRVRQIILDDIYFRDHPHIQGDLFNHLEQSLATLKADREAWCGFKMIIMTTGSLAGHADTACKIRFTDSRRMELERYLPAKQRLPAPSYMNNS